MTRSIQYRLNRSNTDTSLDPDRYANTRIVARPRPSHEKTLTTMHNLSITYRFSGRPDDALNLQKEIDSLRPRSSSEFDLLEDKLNLSNIVIASGLKRTMYIDRFH